MSQKTIYQDKMTAKLREIDAEIERLKARAANKQIDTKNSVREKIDSIKENRKAVENKLNELNQKGEDAWSELRTGINNSWDELKSSVDEAVEKFK